MRFSCRIYIGSFTIVPADYRRYFLSLIKEAFKKSGSDGKLFAKKIYQDRMVKPFTFSVYMPVEKNGNYLKLKGDYINFFFSSNDYEYLIRVYNGLMAISNNNNGFVLFDKNFSVKNLYLLPKKDFTNKTQITFKTLSPFLIRDVEDGDYYAIPEFVNVNKDFKYLKKVDVDTFVNFMKLNIVTLCKKYLNNAILTDSIYINLSNKLSFAPVIHGSGDSGHEYKITLPALNGQFTIQAPSKVLELLYDIGIGARRSEGFGMLEVVE